MEIETHFAQFLFFNLNLIIRSMKPMLQFVLSSAICLWICFKNVHRPETYYACVRKKLNCRVNTIISKVYARQMDNLNNFYVQSPLLESIGRNRRLRWLCLLDYTFQVEHINTPSATEAIYWQNG